MHPAAADFVPPPPPQPEDSFTHDQRVRIAQQLFSSIEPTAKGSRIDEATYQAIVRRALDTEAQGAEAAPAETQSSGSDSDPLASSDADSEAPGEEPPHRRRGGPHERHARAIGHGGVGDAR